MQESIECFSHIALNIASAFSGVPGRQEPIGRSVRSVDRPSAWLPARPCLV